MTRVAIIGAGPYGLSVAAHLRSYGVPYRIFGTPLDSWRRHMPVGMVLKSQPFASSLSDPDGEGTLAAYCAQRGIPYHDTDLPVSLDLLLPTHWTSSADSSKTWKSGKSYRSTETATALCWCWMTARY